jgi:hypothetical protein
MILGESGRGKSRSIKSMNPKETIVIKSISKPFPFRSSEWTKLSSDGLSGSIISTDKYNVIESIIIKAKSLGKKVVIIDDAQYLMANEFMNKSADKGFDKFSVMAKNMWSLITTANEKTDDDVRVYFLQHTETTADGSKKAKTIGKMLDDKITLEGMFTIVLNAEKENQNYFFTTQNSGADTAKSPEGMFETFRIENDLRFVDDAICDYYNFDKQTK